MGVKNASDIDSGRVRTATIVDQVLTHGEAAASGKEFVARTAQLRIGDEGFQRPIDPLPIVTALNFTPSPLGVQQGIA